MVRKSVVVGALFFAMLGAPRTSEAGLFDFIWEMSGPQMFGVGYGCLFTTQFKKEECRLGAVPAKKMEALGITPPESHGPFISLNGSYFFSTDRDSATQKYDWLDVQMVAFEPGVAFRSIGNTAAKDVRIHHGVGVSYNFLFGRNFKSFDKFAFTFSPFDFAYKDFAVGLTIRLYPNGFTDDEFGFGPRVSYDRPPETVYGMSFTWRP